MNRLIFLPLRPRIPAAVETAVVKRSRKWRCLMKLSWRRVVTRGAPGLGRSFVLPVTANFRLKQEIVDWLTLNCLASRRWLTLACKSPIICPLESGFSLGMINGIRKNKKSHKTFKPRYQMSTSCIDHSMKINSGQIDFVHGQLVGHIGWHYGVVRCD